MMKHRTTVERSHKRILVDYNIEAGRCRSSPGTFHVSDFGGYKCPLGRLGQASAICVLALLDNPVTA
jgi:hypothetical protein